MLNSNHIVKRLFILLVLLVPIFLKAQDVGFGVKGGFNFSTLYIDDAEDRSIRPGFHAGLFSEMKLSESLGLQGELLYTTAGNRTIYDNLLLSGEADFNLNYIQVPVMLTLRPVNVLSLHGGFYTAYLTSAVTSYEGDLVNSFAELDRDNFNDIDYGFVAGAAINLDRLQLGLRYNLGLNQVANSDIASDFLGDSKNVIGQVYISIKL